MAGQPEAASTDSGVLPSELSSKYAGLTIDATRLISTLDTSCTWGK